MNERRKRLIEVAFPLAEVSAHSDKENRIRHGRITSLHTWWARRPLAACRAFIYASLVDDPATDTERDALLREVADLSSWDAVRDPSQVIRPKKKGGSGLTGAQLLERARHRIRECNGGEPPTLLDPFAGGGSIPLEALRLGCEVEASDLNPVAVLILKGTLEYPQRFGDPNSRKVPAYIREADAADRQSNFAGGEVAEAYARNPLATDVRYWGEWIVARAEEELAEFYPRDPDGTAPVAYLWSRTIPCPACHAEMPLIRQYWLARKDKRRIALEPVVDEDKGHVDFRVVEGSDVTGSPEQATSSRGDARCLLCGQVVKAAQVREAGIKGQMSATLTSVALVEGGRSGKHYREDVAEDIEAYEKAAERLRVIGAAHEGELSVVPDEPIAHDPRKISSPLYGDDTFEKLFNKRQLLALTTLARLVGEAHTAMIKYAMDPEYAAAVATYLGVALSRYADFACTVARWKPDAESVVGAIARPAIPMVWDYPEHVAIRTTGGSFSAMTGRVASAIEAATVSRRVPKISQADAKDGRTRADFDLLLTDPPYYDSVNYSGVSDFFYVWLKRSIGFLHPDLLTLPLTPKREQTVMNVYADDLDPSEGRKEAARQRYVDGMAQAFEAMSDSLEPGALTGVVFAHTDPDAWSTLIEGLLGAGLVPDVSWPIDTEMETRTAATGQARLRTSVWMSCRRLEGDVGHDAFLGDVLQEMQPAIRERLLAFWMQGIRGADFFISAIGPALSVFGRHRRVLRPNGTQVSVREFLDIVRRESTTVALEQVLHGADLGVVDPITRQYVTWVWSYSRASLDSGEALALCLATGAPFDDLTREHSIAVTTREKSKKVVKLRTIAERAREDEDLGSGTPARPAPLVDELQRAAWLWGQNQGARLGEFRGTLGESRWTALLTLGQAVAECLPDGDEDRRIILGLLGATVRGVEPTSQLTFSMEDADGAD
ncbi:MAG: DUF1156 domain-containing protein [Chloroflexota bacterium]|nr:DUF1156 domain-containing protein [Chloroflexota bacterium]